MTHGKRQGRSQHPRTPVWADEYEDLLGCESQRRSFATAELPAEKLEKIGKTRMHPRHKHLNGLLGRGGGLRRSTL